VAGGSVPALPRPPELGCARGALGSAQAGEGNGSGWLVRTSASSKGTNGGRRVRGPVPTGPGGRQGERTAETRLSTLLPSLQLRQTPRALQNDEGIKPLFYLILWLRI